jgi:iron-sulfur cluster repair protein YtfE (RIC family)
MTDETMSHDDPIGEFEHTHERLGALVLQFSGLAAGLSRGASFTNDSRDTFERVLTELREELLLHFAREEEGLFPYVYEHLPLERERVQRVVMAHDGICGAVLRLTHLVQQDPSAHIPAFTLIFERFQKLYAEHSLLETELLRSLGERLDARQRREVAELARGL